MENYRKKIITRMILCAIIVIAAVILSICHQFDLFYYTATDSLNETVTEFQQGLLTAFGILASCLLYKYGVSIKNETKLKKLYNSEFDERQRIIRQKAGMPMLQITSGVIILAGVITGYFNETIFFTLVCTAVFQLTLGAIVKIYYMKTM